MMPMSKEFIHKECSGNLFSHASTFFVNCFERLAQGHLIMRQTIIQLFNKTIYSLNANFYESTFSKTFSLGQGSDERVEMRGEREGEISQHLQVLILIWARPSLIVFYYLDQVRNNGKPHDKWEIIICFNCTGAMSAFSKLVLCLIYHIILLLF